MKHPRTESMVGGEVGGSHRKIPDCGDGWGRGGGATMSKTRPGRKGGGAGGGSNIRRQKVREGRWVSGNGQ